MRGKTKTFNPIRKFYGRPEEFNFEKRDCTVRAISAALDVPYSDGHKLMKRYGYRENERGCKFRGFLRNCHIWNIFKEDSDYCSITPTKIFNGLTQNKLFQEPLFLKKQWLVKIRRHVYFVDKGVKYGFNHNSPNRGPKTKVLIVYEVNRKGGSKLNVEDLNGFNSRFTEDELNDRINELTLLIDKIKDNINLGLSSNSEVKYFENLK